MIAPGWTCPSCGLSNAAADAAFCTRCGEQRLTQPVPAFLSAWQRWRHSLWQLVRRPGALTADWRDGRRRAQVAPLSLFLAINVVFFVTQSLSGLVVLSIPLREHLHDQPHAALAQRMLEDRLARTRLDRERFADRFDLQQQTLAKASVIAMALPMALVGALLFLRRRAPWATQWNFALHFHAFAMVFSIVFFALLGVLLRYYRAMHWTIEATAFDEVVTGIQSAVLGGWLVLALRRVHGLGWPAAVGAALLLFGTLGVALYAHRFAVFAAALFSA